MRAFFHINGIQGDGTDESPFRPFHIDNLTGWAACYKTNASESLVLAEVENPASFSELDEEITNATLSDMGGGDVYSYTTISKRYFMMKKSDSDIRIMVYKA